MAAPEILQPSPEPSGVMASGKKRRTLASPSLVLPTAPARPVHRSPLKKSAPQCGCESTDMLSKLVAEHLDSPDGTRLFISLFEDRHAPIDDRWPRDAEGPGARVPKRPRAGPVKEARDPCPQLRTSLLGPQVSSAFRRLRRTGMQVTRRVLASLRDRNWARPMMGLGG